jgi:hypothetical protein
MYCISSRQDYPGNIKTGKEKAMAEMEQEP